MDIYMSIIGVLVLIIHRAVMLITFPARFKMRYTVGILFIAYALTFWFREISGGFVHWNALTTFFNCILMCWLLRGSVFRIVFAFYFTFILTISQWYLAEAVAGIVIDPRGEGFTRILCIVLLVMYAVFILLTVKYGKQLFRLLLEHGRTVAWGVYAFGAVFSFVLLTVSRDFPGSRLQYILTILFVVWSFAVFCSAIINTHEKTRHKYEAELAASIISNASGHYRRINELNSQILILRHDMKYHLAVLSKLLAEDNRAELEEYLDTVTDRLAPTEPRAYCGNGVVNVLLASYAERCEKLDIAFDVAVYLPGELPIPNYELCIVLGNLLENAVEACQRLQGGRRIELMIKPLGQQLVIKAANSFHSAGAAAETGGAKNALPASTKKDGGLGLRSVRAVAEKHRGELMIDRDGELFTAYVTAQLQEEAYSRST